MSDAATQPTITEAPVDGLPVTETPNEPASPQQEDFESFMAREAKPDQDASIEDDIVIPGLEPEPKEAQETETKEEATADQKIKIKDKEYSVSEIETLLETSQQTTKDLQSQINSINSQIEEFVGKLKTDSSLFDRLQIPKEVVEDYYYRQFVEPTIELTAEQKAFKYDQLKKEREEQAIKDATERKQQEEKQRETLAAEHYKTKWTTEINSILDKGGLPKSDFVIQRIGGYLKQAIDKKLYHLGSDDIIKAVKSDVDKMRQDLVKTMAPEDIKALLGDEGYAKIQQANVDAYKQNKLAQQQPKKVGELEKKDQKRISSVYDLLR